ncbi:MAG: glycosyltransferase [Elusimicrobiota bacterium]
MTEKISVIIPTFNERNNIVPLIDEIHKELKSHEHEIIVVDDNSPDGTYKIVSRLEKPYLQAVLRTDRRSMGYSVRCGIEQASGEIIVIMDSDFNHQPCYLPVIIETLSGFECVSASRFIEGGRMNRRWRHWSSLLFNRMVGSALGGHVSDYLYGFIACRRKSLELCDYDKIFYGFGDFSMRLLCDLEKNRVKIKEIGVVNGDRRGGKSSNNLLLTFVQYSFEAVKLVFRSRTRNLCTKE